MAEESTDEAQINADGPQPENSNLSMKEGNALSFVFYNNIKFNKANLVKH